jgi:hypothetical protein
VLAAERRGRIEEILTIVQVNNRVARITFLVARRQPDDDVTVMFQML